MCDLPGPGIEPMSPALAGGFLTTVSPGKSLGSISNVLTFEPGLQEEINEDTTLFVTVLFSES